MTTGIPEETVEEVAGSWDWDLGTLVYGDIPSFDEVQKWIESYLLELHQACYTFDWNNIILDGST